MMSKNVPRIGVAVVVQRVPNTNLSSVEQIANAGGDGDGVNSILLLQSQSPPGIGLQIGEGTGIESSVGIAIPINGISSMHEAGII